MLWFASLDYLEIIPTLDLKRFALSAKAAPKVSWFVQEVFMDSIMLVWTDQLFYSDRDLARYEARVASDGRYNGFGEDLEIRTVKFANPFYKAATERREEG